MPHRRRKKAARMKEEEDLSLSQSRLDLLGSRLEASLYEYAGIKYGALSTSDRSWELADLPKERQ